MWGGAPCCGGASPSQIMYSPPVSSLTAVYVISMPISQVAPVAPVATMSAPFAAPPLPGSPIPPARPAIVPPGRRVAGGHRRDDIAPVAGAIPAHHADGPL